MRASAVDTGACDGTGRTMWSLERMIRPSPPPRLGRPTEAPGWPSAARSVTVSHSLTPGHPCHAARQVALSRWFRSPPPPVKETV
ncbi:hypothetical protein FTX61_18985 [Nitriliruptoraceae bacterium ZYF776]|nr:hypothetical protein [Profundirhabdus halotolerans]